jgi:nicotinate-nucleotide adenylyltransferase
MKIAVYSGSFNPIHNGHLLIAQKVLESHAAEEVWFLVSPMNPLKKKSLLWPESDRLAMVKLAVEEKQGMKASDYEFSFPRPTYTVNTLESLRKDYPNDEFILMAGGDNVSNFHRWYKYDYIIDKYGLIVYPRPGYSLKKFKDKPNVRVIEGPLLDISATDIRKKILRNEPITGLVPPAVEEYISNRKHLNAED